jgi:hypothetical protein
VKFGVINVQKGHLHLDAILIRSIKERVPEVEYQDH